MKTLLHALGPMLFDSLGIIVFAVLLVAGAGRPRDDRGSDGRYRGCRL